MARRHWVDRLYVKLSNVGSFFSDGWGDEQTIDRVVELLRAPPPPRPFHLHWGPPQPIREGVAREGEFHSPVADGSLPYESERGRVMLLLPSRSSGSPPPVCIHLAATGEYGFERRLRLCRPLLERGIGALLLENPFYGRRRPARQEGADLRTVAELMTMGRAIIEEACGLALWLREQGHPVGLSGYSMGGQMAALAGALLPFPAALVPVAAPSSARDVFLDGLLARVTSWSALTGLADADAARARLASVLGASCITRQPPPVTTRAAILLIPRTDGYVPEEASSRIHLHWAGSELRWLDGGHVSSYLAGIPATRTAIADAFTRLAG